MTPSSSRFEKGLQYRTYHSRYINSLLRNKTLGRLVKLTKPIKAHISSKYFNGKDPELILGFLDSYEVSYDQLKISEVVANQTIPYFMDATQK